MNSFASRELATAWIPGRFAGVPERTPIIVKVLACKHA